MQRRSQAERTQATRALLIRTGRELMAEHGFAGVSAEQLVAAAGVTRGALHHHFGDKHGLFLAVIEEVERENTEEILAAIQTAPDQWSGIVLGIRRFLDICERPYVVQLAMTDALSVLGWPRWRALEEQYGLGMVTAALQGALDSGLLKPARVQVLAKLVLSAITEAGLVIAHADDRAAARAEAEEALLTLMAGLMREPPK
jgi:AcrR family transcriptional regulator